ncbi:hypothetical protein ECG_04917 [Echinococcus granulosus]|uniref:Uncharacterized protein n=1 Tax=Echinococcus granulosus TaxID=6210 RepID=A0A068WGP2_ECHGR|nr:hypothetical protein ECG_04917 [Echinococcus granulosus]CDS16740.1 hypothetical protein EgrG_000944300 [Echinococcus granulosus]
MAAKIAIKWVVPRFSQRSKKVRIQGREYDPPHLAYLMAVKGVGDMAVGRSALHFRWLASTQPTMARSEQCYKRTYFALLDAISSARVPKRILG